MNNGRIWTVVNPTVGAPIFFIALMITSLFIHFQVLTRTTWFGDFMRGDSPNPAASIENPSSPSLAIHVNED